MSDNRKIFPYDIEYKKPAEKFFRKHEDVREEYINLLWELYCGEHPEKVDIKTIKGKKGIYHRLRIRDWRVVYMFDGDTMIIINTLYAGSRRDIYKKLGGLKSLL